MPAQQSLRCPAGHRCPSCRSGSYVRRNSSTHLATPALAWSAGICLAVAGLVAMLAVLLVPATPSRVSARTE